MRKPDPFERGLAVICLSIACLMLVGIGVYALILGGPGTALLFFGLAVVLAVVLTLRMRATR